MSAQVKLVAGRVGGLCLAAGRSERMGTTHNKLTIPVDGRPLVAWSIDAMCEAGLDTLRVITGFDSMAVRRAIGDRNCRYYEYANWQSGMGASLAFGTREMMSEVMRGEVAWEAMLVCLGDLPGLRPSTIVRILEATSSGGLQEQIVVPTFQGRRGHPVLFGRTYWSALARLAGDQGARSVVEAAGERVVEVEVESDAILADLDTPEDLAAWRGRNT